MARLTPTGCAGLILFGASIIIFGVQGLLFRGLIDGLQPPTPKIGGNVILFAVNGVALIAGGLALLWRRSRDWGAIAIASIFGASFVLLQLPEFFTGEIMLAALVAPVECLVIAVSAMSVAKPKLMPIAQRLCALMLFLFGAVHLTEHAFVASLIPQWLPLQPYWPWITGTTMILAAIALFTGKFGRPMTIAVAAMFLSWLPLIHAARLLANPASPFEWAFATTAVALAGCLILAVSEAEQG